MMGCHLCPEASLCSSILLNFVSQLQLHHERWLSRTYYQDSDSLSHFLGHVQQLVKQLWRLGLGLAVVQMAWVSFSVEVQSSAVVPQPGT